MMISVKVLEDESGHWYIIPSNMYKNFILLRDLEKDEELFEKTFERYRIGGDINLIELFVDKRDLPE